MGEESSSVIGQLECWMVNERCLHVARYMHSCIQLRIVLCIILMGRQGRVMGGGANAPLCPPLATSLVCWYSVALCTQARSHFNF